MTPQAYRDQYLHRTQILVGDEDLAVLQDKTVVFAGVGGVGGAICSILARMGVGRFVLTDSGVFDEPDVNRQWGATRSTLGRNKSDIYKAVISDINPTAQVEVVSGGVTPHNVQELAVRGDVVIDGLDFNLDPDLRWRFYELVDAAGRYCISSPIIGFGTLTLVAAPGQMGLRPVVEQFVGSTIETGRLPRGFPAKFFPEHVAAFGRGVREGAIPSSMIATSLSGVMQSVEALLVLLGDRHPTWRKPVCLPNVMISEPLGHTFEIVHYSVLFPDVDVR
jgi:hypothetical protein